MDTEQYVFVKCKIVGKGTMCYTLEDIIDLVVVGMENGEYNQIHARDTGLQSYKINMEIANKIRAVYAEGKHSQKEVGDMFGIKKTQVGYIVKNKRWCI